MAGVTKMTKMCKHRHTVIRVRICKTYMTYTAAHAAFRGSRVVCWAAAPVLNTDVHFICSKPSTLRNCKPGFISTSYI